MSNKDDDYELCMRAENVQLPKEGFFGVSAATGGLAGKCLPPVIKQWYSSIRGVCSCSKGTQALIMFERYTFLNV